MSSPSDVIIVKAEPTDSISVWELFHQHVKFNEDSSVWLLTESAIRSSIGSWSDPRKYFEVFLAKHIPSGDIVGSCMYEKRFSFYVGRIIWVEQLFIVDSYRGQNVGMQFVKTMATLARDEGARLCWHCFDNNLKAIKFHLSFGSQVISETVYKNSNSKLLEFELDQQAIKTILACDVNAATD